MTTHQKLPGAAASLIRAIGNQVAPSGKGQGRLCVVNYHRILPRPDPLLEAEPDVATFRWHMQLLADCFNVLPLHEAVQMLPAGRMPPRAVAITFDDGYSSLHDLALPVLREFGLAATVFVTSGHLDHGSMWNDTILESVRLLPDGDLDLRASGLGLHSLRSVEERRLAAQRLTDSAKYLAPPARLELTRTLEQMAGGAERSPMLDRAMVGKLAAAGIEIGGHTVTHPILTRLDDASARREIIDNKRELETLTGRPLRLFAYPNGKQPTDFDERHVKMVQEAGYLAAFSTARGAATGQDHRFTIPRSRPWDATPLRFAGRLLHWLAGGNK